MNKAGEPKLVNVPGNKEGGVYRSPDAMMVDPNEYDETYWQAKREASKQRLKDSKLEREKKIGRIRKLGAVALLAAVTGLGLWKVGDTSARILKAEQDRQKTEEQDRQEQERQAKIASEVSHEFGDAESIVVDGNNVTIRIPEEDGTYNEFTFNEYDSSTNEPMVKGGEATSMEKGEDGTLRDRGVTVKSEREGRIDNVRYDLDRQLEEQND